MAKVPDSLDDADRTIRTTARGDVPVRFDAGRPPARRGSRLPAALAWTAAAACAALPCAAWPQVGIRPAAQAEAAEAALDAGIRRVEPTAAEPQPGRLGPAVSAALDWPDAHAPAAPNWPHAQRLAQLDGAAPWQSGRAAPGQPDHPASRPADRAALARRNTLLLGSAVGGLLAYGAAKWWNDGFDGQPDFEREGFFGRGTRYGGIDKLGHAFTNYAGVRLLTPFLEWVGNDPAQARRLAFWTTVGTFVGIEVLDAYSKQYRGSWEDMLANVAGSAAGLALLDRPGLDRLIDLRLGYRRSRGASWDPGGDYEGQVYLLVLKAEGIRALENHPVARYLEVSVGYAARGFDPPAGASAVRRRELQVGVSLNLSRLLADAAYGGRRGSTRVQQAADLAFELVQFPVRAHGRAWSD